MSRHDKEPHGDDKVCVLLSTCPPANAEELAGFLVETGHAACVNVIPEVKSVYRWEGKVERQVESLLVIKCARARVRALSEALVEKHPYDVPEVVVLKVKGGNPEYLEWVIRSSIP